MIEVRRYQHAGIEAGDTCACQRLADPLVTHSGFLAERQLGRTN